MKTKSVKFSPNTLYVSDRYETNLKKLTEKKVTKALTGTNGERITTI